VKAIRGKLAPCRTKTGIYLMRTVLDGHLSARRAISARVSQFSRGAGRDLFNALVEAIHDFDIHVVRSEPEAFLLEGKLIKEFHPRYNISFRDDKRFLMFKVNLNDPIPNFTFTRLKKDDGARYFGPFSNSSALRNTLALVRRQFNLRGCRVFTPGAADYKALPLRAPQTLHRAVHRQRDARTIPGAGERRVRFHRRPVPGNEGPARSRNAQGRRAQDYEKAASLRDLIRDLKETTKKERKFERVPYTLPLAIDPQRDLTELAKALGLREPPQRIEGFDISNISGTFCGGVAGELQQRTARPRELPPVQNQTVEGQDDFASMAEVGEAAIYAVVAGIAWQKRGWRIEDGRWKGSARPSSILHPPSSLPNSS